MPTKMKSYSDGKPTKTFMKQREFIISDPRSRSSKIVWNIEFENPIHEVQQYRHWLLTGSEPSEWNTAYKSLGNSLPVSWM